MDLRYIKRPIKRFLSAIPKQIRVDKVVLFGSSARKKPSLANDIDVLIVSNSFTHWDEDKRLDMLYKASRYIEPEIHPWGVTQKELEAADDLSLLGQIRTTGILVT